MTTTRTVTTLCAYFGAWGGRVISLILLAASLPGFVVFEDHFTLVTVDSWDTMVKCNLERPLPHPLITLQAHFLPLVWEMSLKCCSYCEFHNHRDVSFTNLRFPLKNTLSLRGKDYISVMFHIPILFSVSNRMSHILFLVTVYCILVLDSRKFIKIKIISSVKSNIC